VCEVAVATHTSPAAWWDQDEATVMTVVDILAEVARAQGGSKGGRTRRGEDDNDGGS
jgi:hypothetical protein